MDFRFAENRLAVLFLLARLLRGKTQNKIKNAPERAPVVFATYLSILECQVQFWTCLTEFELGTASPIVVLLLAWSYEGRSPKQNPKQKCAHR